MEYNKEVTAKPREANLWNDVGVCLYKKGDYAESEKCLRQALELNAQHLYAWGNLGEALAAQGRIDESLLAFQHTVAVPAAYCNVAFVRASLGKLDESAGDLSQGIGVGAANQKALVRRRNWIRWKRKPSRSRHKAVKSWIHRGLVPCM